MHHPVRDPALVAERDDRRPLRLEELAAHALVGERAFLDRTVVGRVETRSEAAAAELVQAAQPLRGVGTDCALVDELLEPRHRGLGGVDARLRLLLHVEPVVLEAEPSDH